MECDSRTWSHYFEKSRAQRILAQEDLPGSHWLSTVFLGLDHNWDPVGPPHWFETMIFERSDGKPNLITDRIPSIGKEIFCQRYTTLAEALKGHEKAKQWFLDR